MGDAVSRDSYTPKERTKYRQALLDDLEIFDQHLQEAEFVDHGTIGLELELNLVDDDMAPAGCNEAVLAELSGEYQAEIGRYNVELNHPPLDLSGDGLTVLHEGLDERLRAVDTAAKKAGANLAMIGTLPTVTTDYLQSDEWMTQENRYSALSNMVVETRGELVHIDVARQERYRAIFDDIATESTCTSMQLHLQVAPDRFPEAWNASQAIAGPQVALSANSPLFMGHRTWHESRIPVFKQSIDTRTDTLVNQGVRPRVWFGERWITSVFDLFEENVRYFSPLIPESRTDAGKPMMDGNSPGLHYLNLHNGTVWRWNRPIYDPSLELSHIRVENRLLAAGPTTIDIIADAAFYYGLVEFLSEQTRPVWSRLTFENARDNFYAGAREGIGATMTWPTLGRIDVSNLVLNHLLDQAHEGLRSLDVDEELADKYLKVIEGRAWHRQNGATWQLDMLDKIGAGTKPGTPERQVALAKVLRIYLENQRKGTPVHTWSTEIA
ncbi:glutamate-cysteine ligase family protein [Corynebacterium appendicis]|uniref:glutamate-cysteine ligase family protein n=1 Tax=Corynebacterium appendicis TaxID=163202 RepID=UPI0023557572|nr:glutamate-cysteine ligase family protein [Corynebacterium appendicis]